MLGRVGRAHVCRPPSCYVREGTRGTVGVAAVAQEFH